MRKEEIAWKKQFFLFSQCFPELYISLVHQKGALCGNGLKVIKTCIFTDHLLQGQQFDYLFLSFKKFIQ